MNLIADSGSTKTKWALADSEKLIKYIYTEGINPFYQTQSEIRSLLETNLLPELDGNLVDSVYFYGAGCSSADKKDSIRTALSSIFDKSVIEVESDLLGACRSLLGIHPGIVGILGTGSNSCFYDGAQIVDQISPLGYILGDEGSGADLGKHLVSDCLKNQLPAELVDRFFCNFRITKEDILENVYRRPFPNRFLASLSVFLKENIDEPECVELVNRRFVSYFERNILQYELRDDLTLNFIGSIAYYYSDILKDIAQSYGLFIDKIEKSPLDGLIRYHA